MQVANTGYVEHLIGSSWNQVGIIRVSGCIPETIGHAPSEVIGTHLIAR